MVRKWLEFYRKNIPGFEKAFLLDTASQVPVRATRQIVGEYTFKEKDALEGKRFDDCIARGNVCGSRVEFDVPYRILLPKEINNLLVAGRCVSAESPLGMHQLRPMVHCLGTGQGAGCAAALCVKEKVLPGEVNIEELQDILIGQGVVLKKQAAVC